MTEEQLALLKSLVLQWERDVVTAQRRGDDGEACGKEDCAYELTELLDDMAKRGDS